MRLLLCTAPMVQINTPYPATAYLTAYLRSRNFTVTQDDPALELILRLFSKNGIHRLEQEIRKNLMQSQIPLSPSIEFFLAASEDYANCIEDVITYLQNKNPSLAVRLASRNFVPEGPRFDDLVELASGSAKLNWAFGTMGTGDQARHIASLCLDDIADVIREGIDPAFAFARYGEQLAASQASFTPLRDRLEGRTNLLDQLLNEITTDLLKAHNPTVLGLSVPFAGAMYGALRIAREAKRQNPKLHVILGGGYINTELRSLSDPRVFDYIDFICFDDGERPLECILEFLAGRRERNQLLRTFVKSASNEVEWISAATERDIAFASWPAPTYDGLKLSNYIRMLESLNPMQRLWSDFHWNKITLAHGCYWRKCSFCDTSLDYIQRYEAASVEAVLDRMEALIKETGQTGFHFVDEAAPPKVLEQLSRGILKRGLRVSWWGNIRFEKSFTAELTKLMADAGCIAVTGGLEVASERILKLIQKGVSIEQVAQVTKNFSNTGIFVHAYLMYGFPSQTTQETIDSLEVVRQLFAEDCIQSAFWHRFATTIHSPIGRNPEKFGIKLHPAPVPKEGLFAANDVPFTDSVATPHDALGTGLKIALYNYMHGLGQAEDLRSWFAIPTPKTKIAKTFIRSQLKRDAKHHAKSGKSR